MHPWLKELIFLNERAYEKQQWSLLGRFRPLVGDLELWSVVQVLAGLRKYQLDVDDRDGFDVEGQAATWFARLVEDGWELDMYESYPERLEMVQQKIVELDEEYRLSMEVME